MKCKRSIMGLAALLIVVFHFYIPITKSPYERAIYRAAYIGVDLFFLLSAHSLGKKDKLEPISFWLNRLTSVYLPFVAMTGIAFLYSVFNQKPWALTRVLKILFGVELFELGGGAFLWFVPAILILYLLAPFLVSLKSKFGWKAFVGMMTVWLIVVLGLQFGFHYTKIFILMNRVPIFLIGMYLEPIREIKWKKLRLPIITVGLVLGAFLLYRFGSIKMLKKPIDDIYYLIAIPFTLSLVLFCDFLSEKIKIRNLPLSFIGGFTLELYGLQMIFGYDIEGALLKRKIDKMVAFLITVLILLLLAYFFKLLEMLIQKGVKALKDGKAKGN